MKFLEGVYWDLDGTIANTELEAHLPAFNIAFKDFGLNWNWDVSSYIELLKINGGRNRILHYSQIINEPLSYKEVIQIHKQKQIHYLRIVQQNNLILKTGVYRLIKELYDNKVRQFIVTSSSRKQASLITDYLFPKFNPFEFIIASDDVEFHKPNPMPYQKAIKISGINKNRSIAFEDSSQGLKSALDAKLPTVYIPSNIPISIEKDINFHCFFDTLGSESIKTNVIKGPKLENEYVDCSYLDKILMTLSNAKY